MVYTNYEIQNSAVLKYNISWSTPVLNDTTGKYDVLIKMQLKEARGGVEVYWQGLTLVHFSAQPEPCLAPRPPTNPTKGAYVELKSGRM